jgi:CRISPR-associated protein Cas6
MHWQENVDEEFYQVPDDVCDVAFKLQARGVPVDHAHALSEAVQEALPWFREEEASGVHVIHGADSGNGWYRPNDLLYLTRRTRLELRVPRHRVDDALGLAGRTLDVGGHPLTVGEGTRRPLSKITTLYSRYVVSAEDESEEAFLERNLRELKDMDIQARKLLPGRANRLERPQGAVLTRSLMVAELAVEDAVRLQERGLGPLRKMGCGLFIPHKSIQTTSKRD